MTPYREVARQLIGFLTNDVTNGLLRINGMVMLSLSCFIVSVVTMLHFWSLRTPRKAEAISSSQGTQGILSPRKKGFASECELSPVNKWLHLFLLLAYVFEALAFFMCCGGKKKSDLSCFVAWRALFQICLFVDFLPRVTVTCFVCFRLRVLRSFWFGFVKHGALPPPLPPPPQFS